MLFLQHGPSFICAPPSPWEVIAERTTSASTESTSDCCTFPKTDLVIAFEEQLIAQRVGINRIPRKQEPQNLEDVHLDADWDRPFIVYSF